MGTFKDLINSLQRRYQVLKFDEPDTELDASIRKNLNVPNNEQIIAYDSSGATLDFSQDGVVLTDQALYVNPLKISLYGTNSIPYSEVCSYLFYQENSFESVLAISSNSDFVLYKAQTGRKSDLGRELVEILHIFQKNLKEINPSLRVNYERAIVAALSIVRNGFAENGILSVKHQRLLNIIDVENVFPIDVAYIRAENLYRTCDMGAYFNFVDGLHGKVNEDLIKRLSRPDEVFFDDYIRDISNPYSYLLTRELVIPYSNLRTHTGYNLFEAIILSYLCIRMEDNVVLAFLLNKYSAEMGEKRLFEIMSFKAKYLNEKMSRVYNNLISDRPVSLIELNWTDSMGLTPLHYALILRNWKQVMFLLEAKDWSEYVCPYPNDEELRSLYDFTFLATELYQNPDYLREIFLSTSKLAKPIKRSIEQCNKMIYINQEIGRDDLVLEYEATLSELNTELDSLCEYSVKRARRSSFRIHSNGSAFAKEILNVYEKSDYLFQIFTGTISDWRIYRFGQRFFVTTYDEELSLSYYEWMNQVYTDKAILDGEGVYRWTEEERRLYEDLFVKKEEETRTYHKYSFNGNDDESDIKAGWFSDEAKHDLALLKKEYRLLVKKYHPDNSDKDTTIIMQQIMTERADILSSIS